MRRAHAKWVSQNQEKRAAHILLGNAVKSGKISKPEVCNTCGRKGRLEGHHEDYSKPLDVVWLCRSCHVKLHNEKD